MPTRCDAAPACDEIAMSLRGIGEFALIARLTSKLRQHRGVVIGPGDDCALVDFPDGDALVTTDMLVEGVHFRRDWLTPTQLGRRVAAQNLADIAAMGGVPTAVVVAMSLPESVDSKWVQGVVAGMAAEVEAQGASIVGGDLARGDSVVISMTVMGSRRGLPAVTRANAYEGQVVAFAGDLGYSAAGLAALQSGVAAPAFVARYRVPKPPYAAGPAAARAGATAMIDVSDGLLADAGHIAEASGVALDLDPAALAPTAAQVRLAAELGVDAQGWVLNGGEDHGLLACFPAGTRLPRGFRRIGRVLAGPAGQVTVGGLPVAARGHDHFA